MSQSSLGVSLEDMFTVGAPASRAVRAREWQQPPAKDGERERFEHSLEWAGQVIERTRTALQELARRQTAHAICAVPAGRLFVSADSRDATVTRSDLPEGIVSAQEHCITSDLQRALATGGTAFPRSQILLDRKEGRFLASVEVDGKWFAVSKALLTACICQGLITDVPVSVVGTLQLTCQDLLIIIGHPGDR